MKLRHISMVVAVVGLLTLKFFDPVGSRATPDTVGVSEHVKQSDREVQHSPSRISTNPLVSKADARAGLSLPVRDLPTSEPIDIFSPTTIPPPPMAILQPVPVTVATHVVAVPAGPPPLPFTALGSWTDDSNTTAFLSGPQGTIAAKPGDILNSTYRVDEVTAGSIRMTYLPLKQAQILTWSVAQ